MSTSTLTCHNCGSDMDACGGWASFGCPCCEYVSDADGIQRRYSTGTPCDCAVCFARLSARARLQQHPPLVRLLGQALVALVRAGLERRH